MGAPLRVTTSSQILTGRGCIEIISLSASSQNSFADVYDGLYTNGITSGTHLWHIRSPANDYRDTANLGIPYKQGVFTIIAGTGAGLEVSFR
jgi:hypothetical protein